MSACPGGYYEQLCAWAQLKSLYGWSTERIVVSRGGEICAGAVILSRRVSALGWISYVQHGPLWAPDIPEAGKVVSHGLDAWGASRRRACLVVNPPAFGAGLSDALGELGFTPKPDWFPPYSLVTATPLIDLRRTLDEIYGTMHSNTRYHVRRGGRAGGKVREGGAEDVPLFRNLMLRLCERRGVRPTPSQRDFFTNAWQYLGPSGAVRLFIVDCQAAPVAAAFCFAFGDTFQVWKVGWSGAHAGARPNHLMWWELIKWAKEHGFRHFDFCQIIPEHAEAIVRGKPPEGPYAGVTTFKLGFGGELKMLPPTLYKSYRPVLRLGLRLAEKSVSANGATARVVKRLVGVLEGWSKG